MKFIFAGLLASAVLLLPSPNLTRINLRNN